MDPASRIVAIILICLVVGQLVTGKALDYSFRTFTLEENPGTYWLIVGVQIAALILLVVTSGASQSF